MCGPPVWCHHRGGTGDVPLSGAFIAYAYLLLLLVWTTILPEYVGYQATLLSTSGALIVLTMALVVGFSLPQARTTLSGWLIEIRTPFSPPFILFSALSLIVVASSLCIERHSTYIGGIHTGAVVLLLVGWALPRGGASFACSVDNGASTVHRYWYLAALAGTSREPSLLRPPLAYLQPRLV